MFGARDEEAKEMMKALSGGSATYIGWIILGLLKGYTKGVYGK